MFLVLLILDHVRVNIVWEVCSPLDKSRIAVSDSSQGNLTIDARSRVLRVGRDNFVADCEVSLAKFSHSQGPFWAFGILDRDNLAHLEVWALFFDRGDEFWGEFV